MANKLTKILQNLFGWQTSAQDNGFGSKKISIDPIEQTRDEKGRLFISSAKRNFPSELKDLWDWYLNETADNAGTMKNRMDRYHDMDYMFYNDSIASMAVSLYADEVSQLDDQFQIIKITSKNPEVAKELRKLYDRLGINQTYIREVAYNLTAYGDSFDIISSKAGEGITALTPVDVYDVTDRLEFKASETKKIMKNQDYYFRSKNNNLNGYISNFMTSEGSDPSSAFKSYLFGFVVGEDHYLAPWQVLHYRLNSRRSEFFPFGRPQFINLVGPYRQLKTSMNLMALARTRKFPKQIFEVDTSEEMTASEKWEAVNEARQEYGNLGKQNKTKEEFAMGEEIWLPKDLISFQNISTDVNLDDIADIEMLRDNFIMGTRVPKGYLIVDEGTWGTSSQSLLQQSKPFARAINYIQSEILDRLTFLGRLHFLISGKFDKEFTEFELSMNFPVVEDASDRVSAKKDSLDFANDIIRNLKDAIGFDGDKLPSELVKQIFSKFTFLSPEEVEYYVDTLVKAGSVDNNAPSDTDSDYESIGKMTEKIERRLNEDIVRTVYFDTCAEKGMTERTVGGRHYRLARKEVCDDIDSSIFENYRNSDTRKLFSEQTIYNEG